MANESGKKGLPVLAWVGIGCGGLLLVGFIGFAVLIGFGAKKIQEVAGDFQDNPVRAAAEIAVRLNPELELVSTDEEAGTMIVRNTRDGTEATLNFEDIAEGKFSMTTDEGEYSVDASDTGEDGAVTLSRPDGETRFGASADLGEVPDWVPRYPETTEARSVFHSTAGTQVTGAMQARTNDDAGKVVDFYKSALESDGYDVTTASVGPQMTVTGQSESRNVTVMVNGGDITVSYQGEQ